MFSIISTIFILATISLRPVKAGPKFDNAGGTIYYDLNNDCVPGTDAAGAASLNIEAAACGYGAAALGNSRMVAVSEDLFSRPLCGAEIIIYKDGQPVVFDEGPLFVGNMCPKDQCNTTHIDIGAVAATAINGYGPCNNTGNFSYEITDQIIGPIYSSIENQSLDAWKNSGSIGGGTVDPAVFNAVSSAGNGTSGNTDTTQAISSGSSASGSSASGNSASQTASTDSNSPGQGWNTNTATSLSSSLPSSLSSYSLGQSSAASTSTSSSSDSSTTVTAPSATGSNESSATNNPASQGSTCNRRTRKAKRSCPKEKREIVA